MALVWIKFLLRSQMQAVLKTKVWQTLLKVKVNKHKKMARRSCHNEAVKMGFWTSLPEDPYLMSCFRNDSSLCTLEVMNRDSCYPNKCSLSTKVTLSRIPNIKKPLFSAAVVLIEPHTFSESIFICLQPIGH